MARAVVLKYLGSENPLRPPPQKNASVSTHTIFVHCSLDLLKPVQIQNPARASPLHFSSALFCSTPLFQFREQKEQRLVHHQVRGDSILHVTTGAGRSWATLAGQYLNGRPSGNPMYIVFISSIEDRWDLKYSSEIKYAHKLCLTHVPNLSLQQLKGDLRPNPVWAYAGGSCSLLV